MGAENDRVRQPRRRRASTGSRAAMDQRFRPRVIIGDCFKEIPKLDPAQFDVVLTSPPYGIGKEYEASISVQDYENFARKWLCLMPRLMKPTGSLWLNSGSRASAPWVMLPLAYLYWSVRPPELHLWQEIIWTFKGGSPWNGHFAHRHESLQWFVTHPSSAHLNLDQVRLLPAGTSRCSNPLGRNPGSVWAFERTVGGRGAGQVKRETKHPCIWPEALVERVLLACCPAGGRVLDIFAGTGTVGRVAERLGIESVLIERNERYIRPLLKSFQ